MEIGSPFDAQDLALPQLTGLGGALAFALFAIYSAAVNKQSKPTTHGTKVHTLAGRKPLIGDLPEMGRNAERINYWITETSLRLNGELSRTYLPGIMNILVLTTPELVDEVMATQFDE